MNNFWTVSQFKIHDNGKYNGDVRGFSLEKCTKPDTFEELEEYFT